MWDLPRPGLEPMSPALAGRFLTTVLPGKSLHFSCVDYLGMEYTTTPRDGVCWVSSTCPRDSPSALLCPAVCPRRLPCTKGLRWLLISVGFGGGWGTLATGKRERGVWGWVPFCSLPVGWLYPSAEGHSSVRQPSPPSGSGNCSSPNRFRFTGDNSSALSSSRVSWVLYTLVTLCKSFFY